MHLTQFDAEKHFWKAQQINIKLTSWSNTCRNLHKPLFVVCCVKSSENVIPRALERELLSSRSKRREDFEPYERKIFNVNCLQKY